MVVKTDKWIIWTLVLIVSLVRSFGNILFEIASNHIGKISWKNLLDLRWDIQILFTPTVFIALFLMFLGRFTSIIPTSYMGITQLITSITILTLIFTVILDTVFLKPKYPLNVWIGILTCLIAVCLMTYNIKI